MTKSSAQRVARKTAQDGHPCVDGGILKELRESKADLEEKAAIAQEAQAKFQRIVVQSLTAIQQPVDASIICLDCGVVRRNTVQVCPRCGPQLPQQ
jgi:hypothetical protein